MTSPLANIGIKMPISQEQGSPLPDHQIQEIASLLKDTNLSIPDIAKNCQDMLAEGAD